MSSGSCNHASLRALSNGHCVLCDGPLPLTYDEEAALLREEERAAQLELEEVERKLMRLDFWEFVQGAMPWVVTEPFEASWHHQALCVNLQRLYEEYKKRRRDKTYVMQYQKLIMNLCPSSLKSRITMVLFPAWVWLDDPTFTWGCLSINPTNVKRDSEDCRAFVGSPWYTITFKVRWRVKENIDSKAKFQLSTGGERISRGLLADHVGMHVNGILIDDPDDAMGVHSEAERKERAGKLESLMSRVADKRCCMFVVIQQRVHVDDCTGELLARGGWLHANYALIYHASTRHDTPWFTDPRTKDGDVLQPDRFTPEVIAALRIELGEFGFEAQGNGNPSSMSGGMLPLGNWRFCRIEEYDAGKTPRPANTFTGEPVLIERDERTRCLKIDWFTVSVDCTFGSLSETASAVSIGAWCGRGIDRFRVDEWVKPADYIQTKQAIRDMLKTWSWAYAGTIRVIVEKKANGEAVINELGREFSGFVGLDVEGGKETRAYAMSPDVDSGHVHVLDGAHWMPAYLGEVSIFPHGKRDDRVDDTSQLIAYHREPTESMKLLAKNAAFKQLANVRMLQMQRGMR